VGQSYCGNLAAHFLGDQLIDWLWKNIPKLAHYEQTLRKSLREFLDSLTPEATRFINSHARDDNMPKVHPSAEGIYRGAIEDTRAKGSETTFSCGYIVLPNNLFPDGLLVLAWMGDSPIKFWGAADRERSREIANQFHTGHHWSSKSGLFEREPNVLIDTLHSVRRIIACSDGLQPIYTRLNDKLRNDELDDYVEKISSSENNDDISFIELCLEPQVLLALPQPAFTQIKVASDEIYIQWLPVPDAVQYEVTAIVDSQTLGNYKITENTWRWNADKLWTNCKIRVQSQSRDEASEWSILKLDNQVSSSLPLRKRVTVLSTTLIILALCITFLAGAIIESISSSSSKDLIVTSSPSKTTTSTPFVPTITTTMEIENPSPISPPITFTPAPLNTATPSKSIIETPVDIVPTP